MYSEYIFQGFSWSEMMNNQSLFVRLGGAERLRLLLHRFALDVPTTEDWRRGSISDFDARSITLNEPFMKIAVYDTFVTKKDGQIMHFDVMVPEEAPPESVLEFANTYLGSVGQGGQKCGVNECKFCHVERARPEIEQSIRASGYYIVEMERCR